MKTRSDLSGGTGDPAGRINDVLSFLRLIWALDHGLSVTSRAMVRVHGVTGPQRLVIRFVGCFPGISPGHLARFLRLPPGAVTAILTGLEGRGLIEWRHGPLDGRSSRLGLTSKGALLDKAMPGTVEDALERTLARFSAAKIEAARAFLATLAEAVLGGPRALPRRPLVLDSRPSGRMRARPRPSAGRRGAGTP